MMKSRLIPAKSQQWTERLQRFRFSGQTVKQFCLGESVSVPSFYHWKRRLADSRSAALPWASANDKPLTKAGKPIPRRSGSKPNRKRQAAFSQLTVSPWASTRSTIRLGG